MTRSCSPGSTSMRRRWPASRPSRGSSHRSTRTGSSSRGGRSPPASTSTNDFFIRTSDDGHKQFVQEFLLADPRQRPRGHLPGRLCGPLLRRMRGVQERGRAGRREVPRARHRARVDRGDELVLPALRVPGAAARALRRAPGLRPARVPGERGTRRSSPEGSRTSRSAAPASRGASRSPGIPTRSSTSGRTRSSTT